jgi:hypothetical protein
MENTMIKCIPVAAIALVMAALGPAAWAQHGQPPAAQSQTQSLQGGDNSAWTDNAHMHAFYDLTVATLGKGTGAVDFEAYRDKSYAIFRAFGTSMGWSPDGMVDHLKDIPRQLVGIVQDDPKVLDSYKNFTLALMGPE